MGELIFFRRPPDECKVLVANLAPRSSIRELRQLFGSVSLIHSTTLFVDGNTARYALIRYYSQYAATQAVKMFKGYPLRGYPLDVRLSRVTPLPAPAVTMSEILKIRNTMAEKQRKKRNRQQKYFQRKSAAALADSSIEHTHTNDDIQQDPDVQHPMDMDTTKPAEAADISPCEGEVDISEDISERCEDPSSSCLDMFSQQSLSDGETECLPEMYFRSEVAEQLSAVQSIELMNYYVGFNGWTSRVVNSQLVQMDRIGLDWRCLYMSTVRVELQDGQAIEAIGFGDGTDRERAKAVQFAHKGSISEARRRALSSVVIAIIEIDSVRTPSVEPTSCMDSGDLGMDSTTAEAVHTERRACVATFYKELMLPERMVRADVNTPLQAPRDPL